MTLQLTFTHSLLNLSIGHIYPIVLVKHLGVIRRNLSLTSHIQTISKYSPNVILFTISTVITVVYATSASYLVS